MCAEKSATSTQATEPTDAATATATGIGTAEPTEAASAEAATAELARCAGLTRGRLGGAGSAVAGRGAWRRRNGVLL